MHAHKHSCIYCFYRRVLYAHTRIVDARIRIMLICTYAYVYTLIRVYVLLQIRVYLYAYIRIYMRVWCVLLFRTKTFLCVSLLWKRKSLKKQRANNEKLTYSTKLMAIMLQTHTLHHFKYLLNNEKKQFICFIFCCWWIRTKRKMLLKFGI